MGLGQPMTGRQEDTLTAENGVRTPKIFCIGFHKTGTSSLGRALRYLGYRVGHPPPRVKAEVDWSAPDIEAQIWTVLQAELEDCDALQDSPCAFFYEQFDRAYPGSKFILTIRDPDDWMASFKRHFGDRSNPLRRWMYGADGVMGNEARFIEVYMRRTAEAQHYFRDRPNDLLQLDLAAGDGWYELVTFLGKDLLPPFPRLNRSASRPSNALRDGDRPDQTGPAALY